MSNHTPGPWRIYRRGEPWKVALGVGDTNGGAIADLWRGGQEKEANARLISTAPDGLALAQMIVDNATIETPVEWVNAANEIIRKAGGV